LNDIKREILKFTNKNNVKGTLKDAIKNADVFIGVSQGSILSAEDISTMNKNAIILALANPTPEISPELAYKGGAGVVGTGRSDLHNQVNNVLAFPGIFKGALAVRARSITNRMKIAAAYAIADCVQTIERDCIIPNALDMGVADKVAEAVMKAYLEDKKIEAPKHEL
jgi:malate dehydrogenase (oxaloacetate-decarboxylating)